MSGTTGGRGRFRPLGCDEVEDLGAEFALGLLDGADRAAVVAHLEGCRACRSRVALLAEAGEQMLLVAPSAEPPPGFEQRVLDRLGPQGIRPRPSSRSARSSRSGRSGSRSRSPFRSARTRWFVPVLAVAAAVAVVLGGAAVVLQAGDRDGDGTGTGSEVADEHPETDRHSATLLSSHGQRDVGEVVIFDSDPRVVEVDMAEWMERVADWDDPPPGPWTLAVERADGSREQHILALADDPRPRIPLQTGGAPVASVAIQDGTGHVWCSATL
jgi:hypothetical protein